MGAGTNASIIRISLFPPSTCSSAPREDRTWRLVLKQTQEAVQHTHSIHSEESRKETALPMSHVSSKDGELKSPTLCQCSFHREKKKNWKHLENSWGRESAKASKENFKNQREQRNNNKNHSRMRKENRQNPKTMGNEEKYITKQRNWPEKIK